MGQIHGKRSNKRLLSTVREKGIGTSFRKSSIVPQQRPGEDEIAFAIIDYVCLPGS